MNTPKKSEPVILPQLFNPKPSQQHGDEHNAEGFSAANLNNSLDSLRYDQHFEPNNLFGSVSVLYPPPENYLPEEPSASLEYETPTIVEAKFNEFGKGEDNIFSVLLGTPEVDVAAEASTEHTAMPSFAFVSPFQALEATTPTGETPPNFEVNGEAGRQENTVSFNSAAATAGTDSNAETANRHWRAHSDSVASTPHNFASYISSSKDDNTIADFYHTQMGSSNSNNLESNNKMPEPGLSATAASHSDTVERRPGFLMVDPTELEYSIADLKRLPVYHALESIPIAQLSATNALLQPFDMAIESEYFIAYLFRNERIRVIEKEFGKNILVEPGETVKHLAWGPNSLLIVVEAHGGWSLWHFEVNSEDKEIMSKRLYSYKRKSTFDPMILRAKFNPEMPGQFALVDHLNLVYVSDISLIEDAILNPLDPNFPFVYCLQGHTMEICSMSFFPNGKRLLTVGVDGLVAVWNLEDLNPEKNRIVTAFERVCSPSKETPGTALLVQLSDGTQGIVISRGQNRLLELYKLAEDNSSWIFCQQLQLPVSPSSLDEKPQQAQEYLKSDISYLLCNHPNRFPATIFATCGTRDLLCIHLEHDQFSSLSVYTLNEEVVSMEAGLSTGDVRNLCCCGKKSITIYRVPQFFPQTPYSEGAGGASTVGGGGSSEKVDLGGEGEELNKENSNEYSAYLDEVKDSATEALSENEKKGTTSAGVKSFDKPGQSRATETPPPFNQKLKDSPVVENKKKAEKQSQAKKAKGAQSEEVSQKKKGGKAPHNTATAIPTTLSSAAVPVNNTFDEDAFKRMFNSTMEREMAILREKLHQEFQDRRTEEKLSQQRQLAFIGNLIAEILNQNMQRILQDELQNLIYPMLDAAVGAVLDKRLNEWETNKFAAIMDAARHEAIIAVSHILDQRLKESMDRTLNRALGESLIPAWERGFSKFSNEHHHSLSQMQHQVVSGIAEAVQQKELLAKPTTHYNTVRLEQHQEPPQIKQQPAAAPVSHAHAHANVGAHVHETAASLRSSHAAVVEHAPTGGGKSESQAPENDLQNTFIGTLASRDEMKLMNLLQSIPPSLVFQENSGSKISQPVILALLHQLGRNLERRSPSYRDLSLNWIAYSLYWLDLQAEDIFEYAKKILPGVHEKLQQVYQLSFGGHGGGGGGGHGGGGGQKSDANSMIQLLKHSEKLVSRLL